MTCKKCKKEIFGSKEFCSKECRNFWVSEMMIKKSASAKKKFGNAYYLKKTPDDKQKE